MPDHLFGAGQWQMIVGVKRWRSKLSGVIARGYVGGHLPPELWLA
jgi:hypothetical protein